MRHIQENKSNWRKLFKERIVDTRFAPSRYHELLSNIDKNLKVCNLKKEEIARMSSEQDRFSNDVFNRIRAEKGKKVEKYKISANYEKGKKTAGIWFLTNEAFVILDTARAGTPIKRYDIDKQGKLTNETNTTIAELEKNLSKFAGTPTVLTKHTIDSLKNILSDDVKLAIGA